MNETTEIVVVRRGHTHTHTHTGRGLCALTHILRTHIGSGGMMHSPRWLVAYAGHVRGGQGGETLCQSDLRVPTQDTPIQTIDRCIQPDPTDRITIFSHLVRIQTRWGYRRNRLHI